MAFNVHLEPRGLNVECLPGETILEAANRAQLRLRHSCDAGSCRICKAKLLEGSVKADGDKKLTAGQPDSETILCCRARPTTDCTLEILNVLAKGELPQTVLACQLASVSPLNHDVTEYRFKLPAGKKVDYYPGQYLEIVLDSNTGQEKAYPFSIANTLTNERIIQLHIRNVPDSRSMAQLNAALVEKEVLNLRLPFGECTLEHVLPETYQSSGVPLVFLAGSTGFAPIKAMLETLLETEPTLPIYLYWGGRTEADLYQHKLAQSWSDAVENFTYIPVVSEPQNSMGWTGRTGFVHKALMEDLLPFSKDLLIIAGGSPGMVHAAYDDFIAAGLDKAQLKSDVFAYAPRD